MYKLLLCWRYLKTRYLALACIVSVMLGVATLIVVNSVMSGFSTKLRERLHALLSDVVIESRGLEGFHSPEQKMDLIRKHPYLGEQVEAMAATLEVFAMLQYTYPNGQRLTRPVQLVGVDPRTRSEIGGFANYLKDMDGNTIPPSFELSEKLRKRYLERDQAHLEYSRQLQQQEVEIANPEAPPPPMPPKTELTVPHAAIVGNLIASFREEDPKTRKIKEHYVLQPGDDIVLVTVSGAKMTPVYDRFAVAGYFKSEMSEYDGNYVFVPLDHLQHLRTMDNRVTSIQIKLKDYDGNAKRVKEELEALFEGQMLVVRTWEDKQGPLLQAIAIEKGILNVLLFLIIAVAGFGILAIFSMIVAEKTRDIGILKSLGATNGGILKIFLGYGLLLGIVGSGLGSVLGLVLTDNINSVEQFLTWLTGQEVFDRKIYYFNEIPTNVQPMMIVLVNVGAMLIAVLFSILPALRAAWLHPVRALRYE